MKITKRQLRRIIQERGFGDKLVDVVFGEIPADGKPRDFRHEKLNTIIDAVNDARREPEIKYAELKNFLWTLNSRFANNEVIEVSGRYLRNLIREAMGDDFFSDREASPHDESMYGEPEGGYETPYVDANRAYELIAILQEFGYELFLPPATDSNNIAIDDALAGYPGEFTSDDLMTAIRIAQGRGA